MESPTVAEALESLPGDTLLKRIDTNDVIATIERLSSACLNCLADREIMFRSGIPPVCGAMLVVLPQQAPTLPDTLLCAVALVRCFTTSTTVDARKGVQPASSTDDAEENLARLVLLVRPILHLGQLRHC